MWIQIKIMWIQIKIMWIRIRELANSDPDPTYVYTVQCTVYTLKILAHNFFYFFLNNFQLK